MVGRGPHVERRHPGLSVAADVSGFRPEDFAPEINVINQARGLWFLFGGMATILWAERYLDAGQLAAAGLPLPLASKDLDLRGRLRHVLKVRELWPAPARLHRLTWKDTGRLSWSLASHPPGDPRRRVIEVTEQIPGLDLNEGFAHPLNYGGVALRVLDPLSCLKAKTDVLRREMAENLAGRRKDLAHVKLLRQVVAPYLADLVRIGSSVVGAEAEEVRSVAIVQAADDQLAIAATVTPSAPRRRSHPLPSI